MILDTTAKKIEMITASAGSIDWITAWADLTSSTFVAGSADGAVTTATTTDIVAAPGASTQRQIKSILIKNKGAAQLITVQVDNATANREVISWTLSNGDLLEYNGDGWRVHDAHGRVKTLTHNVPAAGTSRFYQKTGTGADATGYWYAFSKDAGIPGAWAPGTPGLAGRICEGSATADVGSLNFPAGPRVLTSMDITTTALQSFMLVDFLWVNSGVVVTTTTAQTINSVALPARDDNNSTNGRGCIIGLLATAALGNAAVVNNSTISYTNELGTAGRTATLANVVGAMIPATPVIGTIVWFQLQAGDHGVRSIENITLNTSLTSGSLSLVIARVIMAAPVPVVNTILRSSNGTIRIADNACLHMVYQAANTTAPVISAVVYSEER